MNAPLSKIQKARMKMLIKHPFFATLMMSMPMIEDNSIPTAATDMKSLYYNSAFIDGLDDDVVMFVIAHEVMHVALEHGIRRTTKDPMLWNIAADYVINPILKDSGFTIWDQCLYDKKYEGMSSEQVYDLLKKEQQKQPKPKPGQGDPSKGEDGEDGQTGAPGQGKPQPGVGEPGGQHHSPMLGDLKEPDTDGSAAAEDTLRRDIQQKVAQAATVARMAGNLSGSLERFVGEILNPKVPWQDMLREYMTASAADEESWSRRNRRFGHAFLPAKYSERMGPIIEILDTSGSIGNDELQVYASEGASIAEEVKPESIRLVWADTRVAGEQLFEDGEEVVPKPKGGGGTDMRVPLKHVEQYDPEVVILFTDGYTPWPTEEPPYPLIVVCTTNAPCPIGQVVRI